MTRVRLVTPDASSPGSTRACSWPTHYDDFFAPLGSRMKLVRKVNLEAVPDEVRAVSRDATVAALRRVD